MSQLRSFHHLHSTAFSFYFLEYPHSNILRHHLCLSVITALTWSRFRIFRGRSYTLALVSISATIIRGLKYNLKIK